MVVLVITYLSLIIGELVPKRIALHSPERIASIIALPMKWLSKLFSPIVSFLTLSTDVVTRLIGLRASEEPPVTEKEITVMIEQGTLAGVFEPAEHTMVKRVFRLGDRTVGSLMTLRLDIVWVDLDDPLDMNLKTVRQHLFKFRYAQVNWTTLRYLRAKDLLRQCLTCGTPDIGDILQNRCLYLRPATLDAGKMKEEHSSSW